MARLRREVEECGDHADDVAVVALVCACHVLELAQAEVVVVALERDIGELLSERAVEAWQLVVDELVHECVGLRRDPHGDLVLVSTKSDRYQVGH